VAELCWGLSRYSRSFRCVSLRSPLILVEHLQCFFVEMRMALGLHRLVQHGKHNPEVSSAGQPPTVRRDFRVVLQLASASKSQSSALLGQIAPQCGSIEPDLATAR
jgi:hypothetical protein